MKNDRLVSDLAEDGSGLYPHLKITNETFPAFWARGVMRKTERNISVRS